MQLSTLVPANKTATHLFFFIFFFISPYPTMTAANFEHYPKNVGILALEMYFPHRVSILYFYLLYPR